MKYIVFNNKKVDTSLFIQLQDMASVLTGIQDIQFRFDYGHYLDKPNKVITASRFWDNLPIHEMEAGYKTDVFLRAIGTYYYTDPKAIEQYMEVLEDIPLKKFGIQLFTFLEDTRLEEWCKRERPGTSGLFHTRRDIYLKYFESQLQVNDNRGYGLDSLFCMLFLTLLADTPELTFSFGSDHQMQHLQEVRFMLYNVFEAKNTADVAHIAEQIVYRLYGHYEKDSMNEYFILPIALSSLKETGSPFDDLKRKSKLKNNDQDDLQHEKEEANREKLPTWHSEAKEGEQSRSFLQFDLESGTKTRLLGGEARVTEDGDQAMGSVQGKSKASKNAHYDTVEVETFSNEENEYGGKGNYGEHNKDAVSIVKRADTPTPREIQLYWEWRDEVEIHIKKLSKTIQKTLEHKKNHPRYPLSFGRLSKHVLPAVLEDFPKVFYKKNSESKEVDAVFMLLVDCSASMYNKMDETKKGIILFHEVLKSLKIPHSIVGFWEEANEVKEGYQPNYYHVIKDFNQSVYSKNGAEIMQLQPQEDNRDGFSIRIAADELKKRKEKHKFLLIFSDGEPAAAHYNENGIVDTKQAVLQARKSGLDVVGMFLSDGMIGEEEEKTMLNIYDKEHVLIPSVHDLPEQFAPLLKRLLLKSIH